MKTTAIILFLLTLFNVSFQAQVDFCELVEASESQEVLEEFESETILVESYPPLMVSPKLQKIYPLIYKKSFLSVAAIEVITPPPETV